MPCFRGIELSVVTTPDNTVLAEFPHPDGSSARFGGSSARRRRHSGTVFLSPGPPKLGAVHLADDPAISVYIPLVPDNNFSLCYTITQRPAEKYLCFRVVINGQDVVAWGVDVDETVEGAVHHALFQPSSEQYQHQHQPGIESRSLRFVTSGAAHASLSSAAAANDGGLIEVHVFRAHARHRRAPQPSPYRGRARYGVANGLLEQPQTASFYDYQLVDANDAPYASFRFHYRSWASLVALQLAPARPAEVVESTATSGKITQRPLPQLPIVNKKLTESSTFGQPAVQKDSVDTTECRYSLKHMAPFTDELCKRKVSQVQCRGFSLNFSSDESPRRRGSPVARRLHAASL